MFVLIVKTDIKIVISLSMYDSKVAQRKADANLINSQKGIDLDAKEFKKLDAIKKRY